MWEFPAGNGVAPLVNMKGLPVYPLSIDSVILGKRPPM